MSFEHSNEPTVEEALYKTTPEDLGGVGFWASDVFFAEMPGVMSVCGITRLAARVNELLAGVAVRRRQLGTTFYREASPQGKLVANEAAYKWFSDASFAIGVVRFLAELRFARGFNDIVGNTYVDMYSRPPLAGCLHIARSALERAELTVPRQPGRTNWYRAEHVYAGVSATPPSQRFTELNPMFNTDGFACVTVAVTHGAWSALRPEPPSNGTND